MSHTSTPNLRIGEGQNFSKSARDMVKVVQLVERKIVVLVVAGSSPILHPKYRLLSVYLVFMH